jgi:hypothetical protein
MDMNEQLDVQEVETQDEEIQEEVTVNMPKIDPEKTFCEQTTYLEFLLSNAKSEEEAEHIKATINDYLDLYNGHNVDDEDEEITEE